MSIFTLVIKKSSFSRQAFKALVLATCLVSFQTQSSFANDIPEDSLKSVMWEYIAKEFLLNDKSKQQKIVMDDRVLVHAPKIIEDQFNTPIYVDARAIKDVQKIVVIADLNPIPKVLTYEPLLSEARLSFRIKLAQSTPVRAAVLDSKGVWHVAGTLLDAAVGGGCSQPAVAYADDEWHRRLAEVNAKIWRKSGTDFATLRFTVRHPMDTGLVDGIPSFHLEKLEFIDPVGKKLGRLFMHEPVSENPTITLYPNLSASAQKVQIKGRDNHGNLVDVFVPAPIRSSGL